MSDLYRDGNSVPVAGGISSTSATTVLPFKISSVTGRLLVDNATGSGTVTDVSVVSANGFAGTVATSTTTPAITLSTTITGILSGNGTAISAASTTGTGAVVLATTPTLTTPNIGAATGTSLTTTGNIYSQTALIVEETGAGTDTITIQAPASIASSYTLTLPVDDGNNLDFLQTNGSGVLAWVAASSAALVVGTTVVSSGTNTRILYDNSGVLGEYTLTGSGTAVVMANTPTLITPVLGVATATSINKVTITAPATSATLSIADGKTLTVSNSGTLSGGDAFVLAIAAAKTFTVSNTLTLAGTDATTMTFPTTSKTIAANDGSNWTLASQAIGDLAYASSTTAYTRLAAVATGSVLVSAGTGTAPAYSANPQVTTIELGAATDTTLARVSAGVISVEGITVDTISAANTLTNKTLTSPTIQTAPIFAAGTNIKFTVPSSDVTGTGITTNEFNSGYSSTAIGDLVYLDTSSTWQKADADASVATYSSLLGIALSVTASGAAATVLLQGFVYAATPFPTFTIGAPIYMSATAGAVTNTAPTTTDSATRVIGYGVHADKMWFNPSNDWITHT